MRAGLLDSDENTVEKRSEVIKSELAKFRVLKSKTNINANDENRETKSFIKNSFSNSTTPVRDDTANRSASVVLQASQSQNGVPAYIPKYETRSAVPRKTHGNISGTTYNDSSSILSSDRFQNSSNVNNSSRDKSPTLGSQMTSLATNWKKQASSKSTAPGSEERRKEKPWSQLEDFINAELDKEMLRGHAQTVKHSSSNPSSFGSAALKAQDDINKGVLQEKRAVSAMDNISKGTTVDHRNITPTSFKAGIKKESNRKSLPGSPKIPEAEVLQVRKKISVTQTPTPTSNIRTTVLKEKQSVSFAPNVLMDSSPKLDTINGDKILKEEVAKWRVFGKMMAESYEDLNVRYQDYMQEKEKDRKIITALKEQVNTLKALLKASKDENTQIKEDLEKMAGETTSCIEESKEKAKEIVGISKILEATRSESAETNRMVEFLKNENEALKKTLEEKSKQEELVDHYQKLADLRFKECSSLAEEIICLRTDLDRSHSNYLRIQREHSSGKKLNGDLCYSGKKLRQGGDHQSSFLGSGSSMVKPTKWSEQAVRKWNDDVDDQPPLPVDFKILPVKHESSEM